MPLIVEIKADKRLAELCRRTRERLRDYGGAYCVESFHPLAVRWFRKHAPEVIRGQLAYGLGMKRAQGKKNGVLDVFLASLTAMPWAVRISWHMTRFPGMICPRA